MVGRTHESLPCSYGPHSRLTSWRAFSFPSSLFITCFHSTEEPWNNGTIQRKYCWACMSSVCPISPSRWYRCGVLGTWCHSLLIPNKQASHWRTKHGALSFLRVLLFFFLSFYLWPKWSREQLSIILPHCTSNLLKPQYWPPRVSKWNNSSGSACVIWIGHMAVR